MKQRGREIEIRVFGLGFWGFRVEERGEENEREEWREEREEEGEGDEEEGVEEKNGEVL